MRFTATLVLDVTVTGKRVPRSDMVEVLTEALMDCLGTQLDGSTLDQLSTMGLDADSVECLLDSIEVK